MEIGLSTNKTGISIYLKGLKDKLYLNHTFGDTIEKASVTGYYIKFKKLSDIYSNILLVAIKYGITTTDVKLI